MNTIQSDISRAQTAKRAFLYTFLWGMAAHAYGFLNFTISHDSLYEFISTYWQHTWKNSLGRIFVQPYHTLFRGIIAIPWMAGLLSMIWAALALYCIVSMFSIRSKASTFLLAGVLITNLSVLANAATYIGDLDANMLAMLCAVVAAYLWQKHRLGWLLGAPLLLLSLGLYQSFIDVAIVLILLLCVMRLLKGERFQAVLISGLKGIGMLLLGGGLYVCAVKIDQRILQTVISDGTPSSFSNLWTRPVAEKIACIPGAYAQWFGMFRRPLSTYPATILMLANAALLILTILLLLRYVKKRRLPLPELLLALVLLALLPLASNLCYVLNAGVANPLTRYAVWLTYLIPILLTDGVDFDVRIPPLPQRLGMRTLRILCGALLAVYLWSNVLTANTAYLKKDLERQATLSSMTRAMGDLDDAADYIRSETPVAFYGFNTEFNTLEGFEELNALDGLDLNSQITYDYHWAYIRYILNEDIVLCPTAQYYEIAASEALAQMPRFPDKGYFRLIDGVMVVKMGP